MGSNTRSPRVNLQALNEELSTTAYNDALARLAHFAPLCDEGGYPLVGSIVSKTGTTASQVCEQVRESKK